MKHDNRAAGSHLSFTTMSIAYIISVLTFKFGSSFLFGRFLGLRGYRWFTALPLIFAFCFALTFIPNTIS